MGEYHDPPDDETAERERALVRGHVSALMEHFESVHVFVTRRNERADGGTISCDIGAGNWFARYGQVRDWIVKEDERTKLCVRRDFEEDEG